MAKTFFPDNRGGMSLRTSPVGHTNVNGFKVPSSSVAKLDRVLAGGPPSILVSRLAGGIGDVLMTLPTVKALKQKYNALIDYATDFEYLGGALPKVLQGNPYISNVVDFPLLDKGAYNAVIDLTCPCILYEKSGVAPLNRIDLFARHAGLALPLVDPSIDYYITDEERAWAQEWVESHNLQKFKLIMVNPNSSTTRRDCPQGVLQHALGRLIQTFSKTHRGVVVLHGDQTTDTNWRLAGTAEMRDYDVRRIAAIMELCDLVICPDSALLHLAGALRIKTLSLFGPTDPRARINYFPAAQAIWFQHELACCPCYWEPNCRSGFACWGKMKEDHILEIAKNMIEGRASPYPWLISFPTTSSSGTLLEIL